MVGCNRTGVITLFWPEVSTGPVDLDQVRTQHARARRVDSGDDIRLVDGRGAVGIGSVAAVDKKSMRVEIARVETVPPPQELEVLVPVADRDRMLLAAEKCVELGVTAWRPVYFDRSRSVSPRGEGPRFREKVLLRMQGALEQCGAAWLPVTHGDVEFQDVIRGPAAGDCVLLDASGHALSATQWKTVRTYAVGPEGGLAPSEVEAARQRGWRVASLGQSTLRFETAIIAVAAIVRAARISALER